MVFTLDEVSAQQGNRSACCTFGRAAFPGCACNIQMCPDEFPCKSFQKTGGSDTTCRLAANVGHICKIRFQLVLIGILNGHAPHRIIGTFCRGNQIAGELVMLFIQSCEQAAVDVSECNDARHP